VQTQTTTVKPRELGDLLRADLPSIAAWTESSNARRIALHVAVIVIGAGCYGAAMGCWRAPEQALYVAIKFPLIILLVTIGNALLNAMLAPLLGLNINFKQSFAAVLMSFAIVSAILGSFSPLVAFMVWNAPPLSAETLQTPTYAVIKLTHVVLIAFAGVAGNVRLFQLLTKLGGSKSVARRVLFAWLAVNLFLGSQLVWIARPFVGAPHLKVAFLRNTAFEGNFFENVFHSTQQIFQLEK
jgi:hypothetical protein